MLPKNIVREKMIGKRAGLKNKEVDELSLIISKKAYEFIRQSSFKKMAMYISIKNEVKIELLFDAVRKDNINIFLPYYEKGYDVCFCKFKNTDSLVNGDYGILYPKNKELVNTGDIDIFFIPGVAFDTAGNRIGYGKGCYDKALINAKMNSIFIGVCYNFQIFNKEEFEIAPNDVKMHYLINENGVILC
jgi:5-formyltetrahydrofolate cyclo-ligase